MSLYRPTFVEAIADNISQMSSQDVANMLQELNLFEVYGSLFEKRNVDGAVLGVLDDAALPELGVTSSLDRKTILGWVIRNRNLVRLS